MALTAAEDVKCGDVFTFHGDSYIALLSFTDERHVTTTITAIMAEDYDEPLEVHKSVFGLQLVRTLDLDVTGHVDVKLRVLRPTDDEIKQLPMPKKSGQ